MGSDRKVVGSFSGTLVMEDVDSHAEMDEEDAMVVFDGGWFFVV